MRFILSLSLLFFSTQLFAAAIATKVLIPKDVSGCELGADDTVHHRSGKPIAALGTITTGGCFDGWTSAVDFAWAWDSLRVKHTDKSCDKQVQLYSSFNLLPGRKGVLENFVAIGDCTHNGVVYTKYTGERDS